MKKIIKSLLVPFCSLALFSCDDYLDVQPVGKLIPTEVTQYENLLNNVYTLQYFMYDNNRRCSYAFLGDNVTLSENHAKYKYNSTSVTIDVLAAYIFYTPILKPTTTPYQWSYGIYRPVGYFNNVIDGIEEIGADTEYANEVIAEAKVGRAWIYLNAALTYGPMYDPSGANDAKVIPLRTSGDPTEGNGPLATTAELFAQVKSDLDYACENAPTIVANPCRANRAAAYALRAEYYMYLRDWTNMKSDAQKAWELALNGGSADNLIYNYGDFKYVASYDIEAPEGVDPRCYMDFIGSDGKYNQASSCENLLYRYAPWSRLPSNHYPSEDWMSIFDKEKDLRWAQFALAYPGYTTTVGGVKYDDGVHIAYFKEECVSSSEGLTHPLLLLTKAEAEARCGDLAAALTSLNTLRKYRYSGENTDLENGSSLSQDELLNEILTERRREQPLVSFQRTVDLKRYALDNGKPWSKQTIEHKIGDKTYSKSINDAIYQSLPIDNAIIEYNPQWGLSTNETTFAPYNAW